MKFFMGSGAARTYTDQRVAALVDAAPGALNTLNELAAALNDDASFSTTVLTALANKEEIPAVANPAAAYALGTRKLGQIIFVASESRLWILTGGSDTSVSGNWQALVVGNTAGATSASSFATQATVDDSLESLVSPFLLAGM